jgi:hypothetical protein
MEPGSESEPGQVDVVRDVWIAHHQMLQEWDAVPHTLRWENYEIDPLTSWYFAIHGWDLSWSTYTARAELADITVQTGFAMPALHAARQRLEAAFPARSSEPSPHAFAAELKSWVAEANTSATSTSANWTTERSAMRAPADAQELLGLRAQGRGIPDGEGYLAIAGNHYLVGAWGARRRLTVEVADTEVVIRSSGYHAGGWILTMRSAHSACRSGA